MLNSTGKPFTVTEITSQVKTLLEGKFGIVEVSGEISNWRPAPTGHCYFTLKDASAQLNAVMFAGSRKTLSFVPVNGSQVTVTGEISVYAARGQYQIVIRKMTLSGQGDLMARFDELKRKLNAEGLFSQERKRPLPVLPRHIGIVTAPGGAAIRDIMNILTRRFPNLDILIAPARVQGTGAAEEIAQGVRDLNDVGRTLLPEYQPRDVIIVTRGGGSLEDLWAFNEEAVARAVSSSRIPVISAVGHEIDFSICDFAADYRAPTPSAAAEIVVRPKSDLMNGIKVLSDRLANAIGRDAADARGRLAAMAKNRVFTEPSHAVATYRQHVDTSVMRMDSALAEHVSLLRQRLGCAVSLLELEQAKRIPDLRMRLNKLLDRIAGAVTQTVERDRQTVIATSRQLLALSPVSVLERGYSITFLDNGVALRSPSDAPAGTRLTTRLAGGKSVTSVVGGTRVHKPRKTTADDGQLGFDF